MIKQRSKEEIDEFHRLRGSLHKMMCEIEYSIVKRCGVKIDEVADRSMGIVSKSVQKALNRLQDWHCK
jgi:hypothetical protein